MTRRLRPLRLPPRDSGPGPGVGTSLHPTESDQSPPHDSSIRYKLGDMYTTIYVCDFPSRSSKLSSRSLRLGNKELLHTTQLQTALYTKVSGTMRSLAGRCYYFSLKRSIDQHCWRLYTFRPRWQWIRL